MASVTRKGQQPLLFTFLAARTKNHWHLGRVTLDNGSMDMNMFGPCIHGCFAIGIVATLMDGVAIQAAPPGFLDRFNSRSKPVEQIGGAETPKELLLRYTRQLESLKAELEEWGSLALSQSIVISADDKNTRPFDPQAGDPISLESLYKEFNKVNESSQFSHRIQTRTDATSGEGSGSAPLAEPSVTTARSNADASGTPMIPAGPGKDTLLGQIGSGSEAFSPVSRINAAASTMVITQILNFLGNPMVPIEFDDHRTVLAIGSLSVSPGWRTRRGFIGSIQGRVAFDSMPARTETIRAILESASYPMGLRALIAQQYRQALPETLGKSFSGKAGWTYEECLKEHVATSETCASDSVQVSAIITKTDSKKSALVLNSFSSSDHFEFELGTLLTGPVDSHTKGGKSARTLDRQTVPVLLILGMRIDDTRPMIWVTRDNSKAAKVHVSERGLQISYTTRWSPASRSFWAFLHSKQKTDEGYNKATFTPSKDTILSEPDELALEHLSHEIDSLMKALHGTSYTLALPAH